MQYNVAAYVKHCEVWLSSKALMYKHYDDLQSLLAPIYQWKQLLINFVTGLAILIDCKRDNYDSILVIAELLRNMVY